MLDPSTYHLMLIVVEDFDPEDDGAGETDDNDTSGNSDAGREHYQAVGSVIFPR